MAVGDTFAMHIKKFQPRKYYILSTTGRDIYGRLQTEWRDLSKIMAVLIDQGKE